MVPSFLRSSHPQLHYANRLFQSFGAGRDQHQFLNLTMPYSECSPRNHFTKVSKKGVLSFKANEVGCSRSLLNTPRGFAMWFCCFSCRTSPSIFWTEAWPCDLLWLTGINNHEKTQRFKNACALGLPSLAARKSSTTCLREDESPRSVRTLSFPYHFS